MEHFENKDLSLDILQTNLPAVRGNDFDAQLELDLAVYLLQFSVVNSQFGVTQILTLISGRNFVIHVSPNHDSAIDVPLLIFLHGSRGNGMHEALQKTRWIERTCKIPFIAVFGQAKGSENPKQAYICPHWNHVAFGELYWEIRNNSEQFRKDIQYLKDVIDHVKTLHSIDSSKIFLMGHSNGGVFCLLVLLYLPGFFRAVCSHMGGIGWDPYFYLPFEIMDENSKKTPLLLVTGDKDVHKQPCQAAKNIFETEGWDKVDYFEQENTPHKYNHRVEDFIWEWFNSI